MAKSAQKRQFEQTVDKLIYHANNLEDIVNNLMPTKGNTPNDCQKTHLLSLISQLNSAVNGVDLEDFKPNDYSGDFKYSYEGDKNN